MWPNPLSRLGRAPSETRETRKVTIEGDPFAAVLDGEGREPGIGDQRPDDVRLAAKPFEDGRVPPARLDQPAVGLLHQALAEGEHLVERASLAKRAAVGGDAHHG